MLRGLIVELVPDQSISLLLPTGETRTIPMDDVSFAGPSEAVPWKRPPEAAPPVPSAPEEKKPEGEGIEPFITLHGERARLRLIGKEPNLTVHVKSGTATTTGRTSSISADAYTSICTAPCEASLPAGTHELGLSKPGKGVIAVKEPVAITGPGTIEARYESRSNMRIAGGVVGVVGVAGGAAVASSGNDGAFGGAVVMIVGSGLAGGLLLMSSDRAHVTFIPAVPIPASDPTSPSNDMRSGSVFDTRGLTVVGTF